MKLLSSLSAGLMLSVATVALVAAPAAEAKKEKKKKAPKLKPSKEFIGPYNTGIAAVQAGDAVGADAAEATMRAAVANEDDRIIFSSFLINSGQQFKNTNKVIEGLDIRIASPLTDPDSIALTTYQKAAQQYAGLKDYAAAAASFEQAYNLGLRNRDIELNAADSYSRSENYAKSVSWMKRAIEVNTAKGAEVPENWFKLLARDASRNDDPQLLTDTMQYVVGRLPTEIYWHDSMVLFQQSYDLSSYDTLDALRLVRKAGAMKRPGQYVEYMEEAGKRGYSHEVIAMLEEGFASGIISKSDISFAEGYRDAKRNIAEVERFWAQDEKEATNASTGFLASVAGDSLYSGGQTARAINMFETALAKGRILDKRGRDLTGSVQLRLGIAQLKQGNAEAAKVSFAKVQAPGATKEIAEFWSIYADTAAKAAAPAVTTPATPAS